jgi:hypothetical protein
MAFRSTTGNYNQRQPTSYKAGTACHTRFENLAADLTIDINNRDIQAVLDKLNNCSERREQFSITRHGAPDFTHGEVIRLINNVFNFFASNQFPPANYTIRFVDGGPLDKNFLIYSDGIPVVAIFSRGIKDNSGQFYADSGPQGGRRRRKTTRKQRKTTHKHRKTRRHH